MPVCNTRFTMMLQRSSHLGRSLSSLVLAVASSFLCVGGKAQSLQAVPTITTVVGGGSGTCAASTDSFGDGCLATQVKLKVEWSSASDSAGNLYVSDTGNNIIRKVDANSGIITLFAGGATTVCAGASDTVGDGCLATQASLSSPRGLTFDPFGNLVVVDTSHYRIRSINTNTGIITTLVGTGTASSGPPSNTAPLAANASTINNVVDAVFDSAGNLFFASPGSNFVAVAVAINGVIVPDQSKVYNLAGSGTAGSKGDGGLSTAALVSQPRGALIDPLGNLIFTDYANNTVRRITAPILNGAYNPAATINTIAGTGTSGRTGDGGPATSARLVRTQNVRYDLAGNLYILEDTAGNDDVRLVDRATQTISTYAGTGVTANAGDNGPAILSQLNAPFSISVDRFGHLFIDTNTGNTVRAVSLNNLFPATAVGNSTVAQSLNIQAKAAVTLQSAGIVSGATSDFTVGAPTGCTVGGALALSAYCQFPVTFTPAAPGLRTAQLKLADSTGAPTNIGVSGVGTAPVISFAPAAIATIAGTGTAGATGAGGQATGAQVNAPRGGVVDSAGNIFFADSGNNIIRKISAAGVLTTVAGNGTAGFAGDGAAATAAQLQAPSYVALDAAGDLYIADTGNNCVRFVDINTGFISTIAGTGAAGYTGDLGDATAATLNHPQGLTVDQGGTIYVADTGNNVVRKFFPKGYISTIAGNGITGFSGNGSSATGAMLNQPASVAIDPNGNLYIADKGNGVVREVSSFGIISTYAGSPGTAGNAGDGGAASNASLTSPTDAVLDAAGNLYIASGGVVRLVDTTGTISTLAGNGRTGTYSGEGGIATAATLPSPASNVLLNNSGKVYISDTAGNRILLVDTTQPVALNLGVQAPNSTGSPTTVSVSNSGNTPLVFTDISISSNFVLLSSGTASCTSATTLAPGTSCKLSIAFSPSVNGTFNGSVSFTDNSGNVAGTKQSISITGIARTINVTSTTVTLNPTSITYGAATTATAMLTGGVGATGNVVFSVNGSPVATVALASGTASTSLAGLAAGTSSISASYVGDFNNASSSGSANIVVQPAVLTVTATNTTRLEGSSNPAFVYTFSGFVNGDTAGVVSGAASVTTTAVSGSSAGSYPLAITQGTLTSANYTFKFVNGVLTVSANSQYGYTIAPLSASVSVVSGLTIPQVIVANATGGYSGTISLSCSGLPADYECVFTPPTLTLTTTQQSSQMLLRHKLSAANEKGMHLKWTRTVGDGIALAMVLPLFLPMLRKRGRARARQISLLILLVGLLVGGVSGCGTATPDAGHYTVAVTATDGATTPRVQMTTFDFSIN